MPRPILLFFAAFWDFIDRRGVIRRAVLGAAIWMTWRVSAWAMWFAESSERPGIDVAAIIAAVSAPITLFAGSAFKGYLDSREEEKQ